MRGISSSTEVPRPLHTSIRRKCHESVMSLVMGRVWLTHIVALPTGCELLFCRGAFWQGPVPVLHTHLASTLLFLSERTSTSRAVGSQRTVHLEGLAEFLPQPVRHHRPPTRTQ